MSEFTSTCHRSVSELNPNQWNNVVEQSDRSTLFHRYEWVRAVEDGFDYGPRHAVVAKNGNPVALMPTFVSDLSLPDRVTEALPVSPPLEMASSAPREFGGPVAITDERESVRRLFDAVDASIGRRVVFHRLQSSDLANVRYGQFLQDRGYEPTFDNCLFVLDLRDGWETIFENMDKERRKDVRAAHEQDYRVEVRPFSSVHESTYDDYAENMERVDGSVLPRAFFPALAEHVDERIRVFDAVVEGESVGRYVFLLDEEASVLRHWLSAIPDASNYEYHPSELLHEHAIKWGIERGFDEYSFGRTGSHFSNSVFRFKQKYGGRVIPVFKMEKGYSRLAWPLYKFGRSRYRSKQT